MKYERKYKEADGSVTLWRFDTNINPNGPIETIADYKVGDETLVFKVEKAVRVPKTGKAVPKTKQKYLNPATRKMVGYVRAKNLGLI